MRNPIQLGLLLLTVTAIVVFGYNVYLRETTPPERAYSQFLAELKEGAIRTVHFKGQMLTGEDSAGRPFGTFVPDVAALVPLLLERQVAITGEAVAPSGLADLFKSLLPVVLILSGWLIFSKKSFKGDFAARRGSRFTPVKSERVTFEDVAGITEAKEELQEIVEFLKTPEKYSRLGGRIPRGVLLQGAPGTGKTLLAKAIAGEASVAFFSMGGSDFVEIFAGVGASRVRELFQEAKKSAPCIIFIDEIDAIGGRRTGGQSSGASDEREQTLNALLVEMDGFGSEDTVIMIAATNRPDILDPALLRPGRFDRQITISLPDVKGRLKILEVHAKKIVTSPEIDLAEIARSIPGFSGAEIANLVNEAALTAARHNKAAVEMSDFDEAKDKIVMGLERKNIAISEKDRRLTAYHEAGHALVGLMLEETDPLHKITIIPRGRAMGVTQQVPLDDRLTYSREYLLNRIAILLGGRAAEALVFNRLTTGASNDILQATDIAARLVCEWGMSPALGPVAYQRGSDGFLGESSQGKPHSEMSARQIDREIKRLIDGCYDQASELLNKHNRFLHKFAEALLLKETMDAEDVAIVYRSYLKERELERILTENGGKHDSSNNHEQMEVHP
ncbi:membrane protease FtsH catalytic subunit [Desulfobulbus propionicus DSM 2032]|jgi:ATP-dependent metalloprotease FtsH|uniref:ATP-dependent zinc metalloprotease FtsH n=1 Tax=Desulfobulbus propionicus (strain ATCC 33891 / DSM 2032 / VKM B-1956 / 1pr3) TaxID=577650 RepID=A0A7U3YK02_DESPD|nr:ATP-dependent zinc metalloprotease FtsH [Desulfobulbus propionicus]ADW16800.1 membrane protease FtsH catalytic subunit [Desulfobulbus propionicus DSM 2032]